MGKTWGKTIGAFTILSALIALAEWVGFGKEWKLAAQGFVLGMMFVGLPSIWLWDSPYRQNKLAREKKKLRLVQQMESRQERLEALRAEVEELDLEIANMKIDLDKQEQAAQSMFEGGPDWMKHSQSAVMGKKKNELFMKEQQFERAVRKEDLVSRMTDDEWRAEQEAKIYVPD